MASSTGHIDIMQIWINRRVDINEMTEGNTPVGIAAFNGHIDAVMLLVDAGADLSIANNFGWTPIFSSAMQVIVCIQLRYVIFATVNNYLYAYSTHFKLPLIFLPCLFHLILFFDH